jgi:hypothetical protein
VVDSLEIPVPLELLASNGGLFVSRGIGTHPTRVITTFELIFVKSGVLGIREGDTHFEVQPNETLLLWPGREHGGTAPYPRDLRFSCSAGSWTTRRRSASSRWPRAS